MKIKYIAPKKLKILVAVCFGIGLWGIVFWSMVRSVSGFDELFS